MICIGKNPISVTLKNYLPNVLVVSSLGRGCDEIRETQLLVMVMGGDS